MKSFLIIIFLLLSVNLCFAGASRDLDGTDDEIDMGDVLDVSTGDVSICGWANTREDAGADWLIGRKNDNLNTTAGYGFRQGAANDLWQCLISDGSEQIATSVSTDSDAVWAFVCCAYSASSETAFMYYNGVADGSGTTANIDSLSNAVEFAMGENGAEGDDFIGQLAYGLQFNKLLTDVEVAELYWKPHIIVESIGGFWPMWGDSPEQDLSGNNNDGTVSNTTVSTSGPPVMIGDAPI